MITLFLIQAAAGVPLLIRRNVYTAITFIVLTFVSTIMLLGKPQPLLAPSDAEIVSYSFVEGKAIYLWLREDGTAEPLYVSLPWSLPLAQQVQQSFRQAQANGYGQGEGRTGVRLNSEQGEYVAHPLPPRPMPPKEG